MRLVGLAVDVASDVLMDVELAVRWRRLSNSCSQHLELALALSTIRHDDAVLWLPGRG